MTKKDEIKKVLITGGAGFIGSNLAQRLVEKKFKVGIIERPTADLWRIRDIVSSVKMYNADLQDTRAISKAISDFKPDVIFHLATYYAIEHKPAEIPDMLNTNVVGAINLLEAARETEVKLFVNTSSCFVYKASKDKLREDSVLDPLNLYALTKVSAEEVCTFYSEKYGSRCITFRIFAPYGPGDHKRRLIPCIIESFLKKQRPRMTSGKQRWDFIYVDDIVDAYLSLLNVPGLPLRHEIFNIGTGVAISVREIGEQLKKIINTNVEPEWSAVEHRKNEVWFISADISKAKRLLGWTPKTQILEKGLELTVKWFKNKESKDEKE